MNGEWRSNGRLEDHRDIVDRVVNALVPPIRDIDPSSQEARERRDVQKEVDRLIGRALWRADRRARQVPKHVRASATYVMRRRRKIAYEVSRAVRSLGGGEQLANMIAEKAAMRWPRDGIVLSDATERPDRPERPRRPREEGTSPRQRKQSPRDLGTSLRDREMNPRAKRRRAAADLSDPAINAVPQLAFAPAGFDAAAIVQSNLQPAAASSPASIDESPRRPIQELAPEWESVKGEIWNELDLHERAGAQRKAREMKSQVRPLPTRRDADLS